MSFIITSNDFTRDPYALRLYRLMLLSAHIEDYSDMLELPDRIRDWAMAAYANFLAALQNQTSEQADKFEAFQTLDESNIDLYERIVALKDLIIARFGEGDQLIYNYRLKGRLPKSQDDRYRIARDIIEGNRKLEAAGDPKALPSGMIDALEVLANAVQENFEAVGKELSEAKSATVELRTLFDEDSRNLRELLNWIVIYWGKIDPRLIELGFAQDFPEGGGDVPEAPTNLGYKDDVFSWSSVDDATSYQLAMSADGDLWEEIYSGDETSFEFIPEEGTWFVRVRARSDNGFGEWSAQISVTIGEGGAWTGEAPKDMNVFINALKRISVTLVLPPGCTSWSVYRAERNPGDPIGERPAVAFVTGLDPTMPGWMDFGNIVGMMYDYWACGVHDGEEGDFAGPGSIIYEI